MLSSRDLELVISDMNFRVKRYMQWSQNIIHRFRGLHRCLFVAKSVVALKLFCRTRGVLAGMFVT